MAINQTNPPLRNSHAACLKSHNEPQFDENHASRIIPNNKTNPIKSSVHLFIIAKEIFYLKILLYYGSKTATAITVVHKPSLLPSAD